MRVDITYHYPPELMSLLIDTIPLLNKAKKDVFLFFQGAGVADSLMRLPLQRWKQDRNNINKFEIARQVLVELNARGETCLRERREVLKRVIEFESFSSCWPADQLKARGLVAEIQKVVNVKDSFTRMAKEREATQQAHIAKKQAEIDKATKKRDAITKVKSDLSALFTEGDRHRRGKALEGVLNSLFEAYGILIREAFSLPGDQGEGVVEQIDGVIELDGHLYFVEVKWWKEPLGVAEISQHLVRVYHRAESRAIIISASDFTAPAVTTCKKALQQKVVVLCTLQEITILLEREGDLREFIKKKAQASIVDGNPYFEVRM
ncbi:MAG: restriction endonuclease [Candidatus Tectomicrobia bacterium]|nr:restriction endonuclease [Candidatus Tectomicrobia bacterium]